MPKMHALISIIFNINSHNNTAVHFIYRYYGNQQQNNYKAYSPSPLPLS